MRTALLTTDTRGVLKVYGNAVAGFGAAPEALLPTYAFLPDAEVHVVSALAGK